MRAWLLVAVAACGGGGGGGGGGVFGMPDAPPPAHSGGAGLSLYKGTNNGTPFAGTSVSASFDAGPTQCPVLMHVGNCYVEQCASTTMHMYQNAGTVHITGAAQPIDLTPSTDNSYSAFTAMTDLAQPGDTLTVTADGTTVPGYSESLAVPSKITVTSPAKPTAAIPISRAADYTVTWSGGTTGNVELSASTSTQGAPFLYCQIAASAGTGTLPAALLGMLPAGTGGIGVTGWSTTTKQVSDWGLYFSVFYDSIWPDNSLAAIAVTWN